MNRNVVLISIDSLRADRCGHLGGPRDLTPTLDRMAADGVAFQNALAPGPKTPESMPTVFTGHQWRFAPEDRGDLDWRAGIRPHMRRHETISERLSAGGYETVAFTPNGFTTEYFGFGRGFDEFEDFLDEEIRPGFGVPDVLRGLLKFLRKEGNWKTWERYYDDVVDRVADAEEPYFLWVFLLDVHSPYLVPRSYRRENSWLDMMRANWAMHGAGEPHDVRDVLVSAYEDTVTYADAFLERLREDLEDTDPVFVVHSDHGEALGERGFFGHERYLYGENLRVPFVVENADASATVERPVSLSVVPSVVEAAAYDRLADLLDSMDRDPATPVVAHTEEGDRSAVRVGPYKLVTNPDAPPELYEVAADPDERRDRAEDWPALRDLLETYARTVERRRGEEVAVATAAADLVETASL